MIHTLEQGERRTLEEWSTHLQCSHSEASSLIDKGILRRIDNNYRLNFVGIFVLEGASWYCRPTLENHTPKTDLLQEFERIDRLLRIYESRGENRDSSRDSAAQQLYDDSGARLHAREIDILANLLEWTQSYGFHEEEEVETERLSGSYRRVDWAATISLNLPHPTRTGILYLAPISIVASKNLSELGVLQAIALVGLFEKYREIAKVALGYGEELIEQGRSIIEERENHLVTSENYLWNCFNATNKDHDKDLIRLLLAYFSTAKKELEGIREIKFYGTPAFHLVWEDMCRAALGDVDNGAVFSNPRYILQTKEFDTEKQRPDIALKVSSSTFILDAKYYPNFPMTAPVLEDVRKQFFYGMSTRTSEVSLAFLFPGHTERLVEALGTVAMISDSVVDTRFQRIVCLKLDWSTLIENYLNRRSIPGFDTAIATAISREVDSAKGSLEKT